MKLLRIYFSFVLLLIVILLSTQTLKIVHAAGNDISINASTSSDHNVQLTGTLPTTNNSSTYIWQWYSQGVGDSTGTLLTDANGGPANTSSIETTTQTAADGTYCDTITATATSSDGTDHHIGSTTIGVTWANGDAIVQSSCASTNSTTGTATGTTPSATAATTAATGGTNCTSDQTICNPTGVTDLTGLIVSIIKYMLGIIGIIAVAVIIFGGYQLVVSAGNADGQKKGKQTIIYAVVGLVLAVLSYSIVSIVENLVRNQSAPATTSSAMVSVAPISNILGIHIAYAASTSCSTDNGLNQVSNLFPAQYCSAPSSISLIISILLGFLGIVSVLFIIIGGYRMVISNGNEEGFKHGRETVTYAIIGLVVAVFAFAVVSIVGRLVSSGSTNTPATNTDTTSNTPAAPATITPTATPGTTTIPSSIAAPTPDASSNPNSTIPSSIAAP